MVEYGNQKMHGVLVGDLGPIYVCESCMDGTHDTYSWDHIETGTGCKNTGLINSKFVQCQCHASWLELLEAIEDTKKESVVKRVRDHHRTIVERGDFSLAKVERVVSRYKVAISKREILNAVEEIYDFLSKSGITDLIRSDLISTAYKWFRPKTLKRIFDAITENRLDTVLSLVRK